MRRRLPVLALIWISIGILTGCVGAKHRVFDNDMPTMKTIHDNKFQQNTVDRLTLPQRPLSGATMDVDPAFHWLPNPTLVMYVFPHLTAAGHPVPGYSTFFRLYTQDHIAGPGERWGESKP